MAETLSRFCFLCALQITKSTTVLLGVSSILPWCLLHALKTTALPLHLSVSDIAEMAPGNWMNSPYSCVILSRLRQ
jgi:hypothetical protein